MFFRISKRLIVILFAFSLILAFPVSIYAEELNFIYSDSYVPFHIIENDSLSGYEIELLNAIFENSEYKVNYISENDVPEDAMFSSLIYFGSGKNMHKENYKASDLIFYNEFAAFTLSANKQLSRTFDFSDIRRLKVGYVAESYSEQYLAENGTEGISFRNNSDLLEALESGRVDIAFGNVKSLRCEMMNIGGLSAFDYHSEFAVSEASYLYIPSDNSELLAYVNMRLDNLHSDGRLEEIYRHNFMSASERDIIEQSRERSIQISVTVVVVCIVLGSIIVSQVISVLETTKFSENLAKGILNYGNRYIIIWKSDYSEVETNDYFKETFGIKEDGKIGDLAEYFQNAGEFVVLANEPDGVDKILASPEMLTKSIDKDNISHEITWTSIAISEKNSVRTILSIGSDTTEKNRLRRELLESDERCEVVLESTKIAYVNIETDGSISYISSYAYALMGIENTSDKLEIGQIENHIHPRDREVFAGAIESCRNSDEIVEREIRVLSDTHNFHWFIFKFKTITNPTTSTQCAAVLFFDNTAEKEKDLRIEKLAFYDDLTGIYNRRRFLEKVEKTIAECGEEEKYSVLSFNIDKFHRFNDLYGVEAGDNILCLVARTLKFNPYGNKFTCARLGNDEFACLIKLEDDDNHLEEYINELTEKFQKLIAMECDDVKFTISAGACIYPDNAANSNELCERAIYSMRIAKNNPTVTYQCYNDSVTKRIVERERLEKEVYEAVKRNQFELYYQPKVDINTKDIVGAEALIRWNHPTRGVVSPVEFISVAEDIGVIGEIGRWTLETACEQNMQWQRQGLKPIKVSVNISAIEFYQSDIVSCVKRTLERTGIDAKWLEIELTESMALLDLDATIIKMTALRELGVGISMDDFGTGYSSLSYIQNLPIDELKLDKSFINKISKDTTTKNITSAVINLAKTIGLVVVAEGVEHWEQFDLLKEMQCNLIQGYLFSVPLRVEEFAEKMKLEGLMRIS